MRRLLFPAQHHAWHSRWHRLRPTLEKDRQPGCLSPSVCHQPSPLHLYAPTACGRITKHKEGSGQKQSLVEIFTPSEEINLELRQISTKQKPPFQPPLGPNRNLTLAICSLIVVTIYCRQNNPASKYNPFEKKMLNAIQCEWLAFRKLKDKLLDSQFAEESLYFLSSRCYSAGNAHQNTLGEI